MNERKKILIVEDEPDLVRVLKSRLERKGYYVLAASDGEAGLKAAREAKPDLIILDINLPKKNGIKFYEELSNEYGRPQFPILVLTARGELRDLFEQIQADGFVKKPFEADVLLGHVDRILKKSDPSEREVFLIDLRNNPRTKEIASALEREHYRVITVENLEEFRKARAGSVPNVIVMEYLQTDNSGEEFIQDIRKELSMLPEGSHPSNGRVPIIVYSYSGLDYHDKSLRGGADIYLGKPESCAALVEAVKMLDAEGGKI